MKTNMYSIEIANIVKQFLTEDSWNFSFDEEHGIFKFGLRIKGKIHSLKYFISIRTNEIIVYGICPIGVDEEDNKMMMEMAEFLHRVNWGLRNGCFEFDFRDGEIRFRSYIDCDKTLPSIESIKNSIFCTAAMFEKYGAGITSIIFAEGYAQEAIAMCEKKYEEELYSILSEIGDSDLAAMMTRQAEGQEITEEGADGEKLPSEEIPKVHMDLFGEKKTEVE